MKKKIIGDSIAKKYSDNNSGRKTVKISAETNYLRHLFGDEKAIKILADAGFECIDYTMDHMVDDASPLNAPDYREYAKHLREYAESLGVSFNQAHAPFEFDWTADGVLALAEERTIRALEIASILGADTVTVHPLHYKRYFYNMDEIWNDNISYYNRLLPYARKYNVRIALENLFQFDSRGVAVYDTCADPARYVKAIDTLNDSHIVACVDVGHSHLLGEDPADLIRALGHKRLHALHIHDNNGVLDDHTLPYLGGINWDSVTKALADIDYDGVFTFESFFFYKNFDKEFIPTAAKWVHDMGVYLTGKIEGYRV